MSTQTKGKCKYCGKEYARGYMLQHLSSCKARQACLAQEKGTKTCGYFELLIYGKYDSQYWLIVEIREDAMLEDLDDFLRDIWLECCGHLSAFEIGGISYDVSSGDGFMSPWEEPAENMRHQLKTVIEPGIIITYDYDFGSTTELVINVKNYRTGYRRKEKVTILSRNNPPVILCNHCHEKEATVVCTECMYEGNGFLCDDCMKTHECGEDMLLPVCNSPRMGVCAYEGSTRYPDQFVPDPDQVKKGAKK